MLVAESIEEVCEPSDRREQIREENTGDDEPEHDL
jgi:hypothetical protein